jgi:tetratricopeptide (TPR) repeat protein
MSMGSLFRSEIWPIFTSTGGSFLKPARCTKKSVSSSLTSDDKLALATTLGNLASVALQEERFNEAGELVVEALKLAEPAGEQTGNLAKQARLYQKLGAIRSRQGQTLEAIGSLESARTLHQQLKMPVLYRDCLMELGIAYRTDRRLPEAESCFREALAFSQNMPHDRHDDLVMDHLADILSKRGLESQERRQLQQALAFFEESAAIWEKRGSFYNLSGTYQNIGNTHIIAGDLDRGLSAYTQALAYRDQSSALIEGIPSCARWLRWRLYKDI